MARHNEIGRLGEDLAKKFLIGQGFSFIEKNFSCRLGEIDLIFKKGDSLRFVEVKSVYADRGLLDFSYLKVQPEENLTKDKFNKIVKTINFYKQVRSISQETPWYIDLVCVYIDTETREAKIRLYQHITLN